MTQLLDDIKANAIKERQEYLLQPIVVLPLPGKDNEWELVDGQQRLTTLYLIVKYIATLLPFVTVDYRLTYETRLDSPDYLESLGTPAAEGHRSDNIDFHHMFEAYAAIESWFTKQGNPSKTASDLQSALSEFVKVIWYQAPEDTVPNDLFARLNVARIPLTDAELVKALVLSGKFSHRHGYQPPGTGRCAVGCIRTRPKKPRLLGLLPRPDRPSIDPPTSTSSSRR